MKIKIDDVLAKHNKSRYWLAKKINITWQNMANLCNNKTTSVKFETIENICLALNCEPNDIFDIENKKTV